MPVYVDPMVNYGKRIGAAGPWWCHMIADTPEELHAMAEEIGLKREWAQGTGPGEQLHYDIGTTRKQARALTAGAIECDRAEFVAHMRRIRGDQRP